MFKCFIETIFTYYFFKACNLLESIIHPNTESRRRKGSKRNKWSSEAAFWNKLSLTILIVIASIKTLQLWKSDHRISIISLSSLLQTTPAAKHGIMTMMAICQRKTRRYTLIVASVLCWIRFFNSILSTYLNVRLVYIFRFYLMYYDVFTGE